MDILYKNNSEALDIINAYKEKECYYVRDSVKGGSINGVGTYDLRFTGDNKAFSCGFVQCVGAVCLGSPLEKDNSLKSSCFSHFNLHELLDREDKNGIDPKSSYLYFEEAFLSYISGVFKNTEVSTQAMAIICKEKTYTDLNIDINSLLIEIKKIVPDVYLGLLSKMNYFHNIYADIKNQVVLVVSDEEGIELDVRKM